MLGGERILILKFVDDMVLVAENTGKLSEMLKATEKYAMKNLLQINEAKTKIMVFRNGGRLAKQESWKLNGKNLEIVNEFKYRILVSNERILDGSTYTRKLANKIK